MSLCVARARTSDHIQRRTQWPAVAVAVLLLLLAAAVSAFRILVALALPQSRRVSVLLLFSPCPCPVRDPRGTPSCHSRRVSVLLLLLAVSVSVILAGTALPPSAKVSADRLGCGPMCRDATVGVRVRRGVGGVHGWFLNFTSTASSAAAAENLGGGRTADEHNGG